MVIVRLVLVLFCVSQALANNTYWGSQDFVEISTTYFKARQVKTVTAISCFEANENYFLMKSYLESGFSVRILPSLGEYNVSAQSNCGVVVDARCEQIMSEMIESLKINDYLVTNIFWLFLDNVPLLEEPSEEAFLPNVPREMRLLYNRRFRSIDALPMTHVSVGVLLESWKLYAIHKPYPQAAVTWNEINWFDRDLTTMENMKPALQCLDADSKDRRNLQGYAMPAATVVTFPEIYKGLEDRTDTIRDLYAKANYPFIKALMYDLNFTLNMRQVDSGGWKINGTFTGLMGLFHKRSIELGILGALMRSERMEVVDYTIVTLVIKTSIIFKQPPLSVVSNIFELPFSEGVWLCVLGFVVIYWLSLASFRAVTKLEPFTLLESMSYMIGTICQQNSHLLPHYNGTKLVFFFSHVASFFIVTSYSASIVALLQSPSRAITSVHDLAQSPLKAGSMNSIYAFVYFNETKDPAVRDLFVRKMKPQGKGAFTEADVGMIRVRDELYAFQAEVNAAYQLIKETFTPQDTCKLYELEAIKLPPFSIPVVKRSKYRELFRQRLAWQREVGIIRRFNLIWIAEKPRCESGTAAFNSVGLNETRYVYMFMVVGFVVAFVFLAGEKMWHKRQMKKAWGAFNTEQPGVEKKSNQTSLEFLYLD